MRTVRVFETDYSDERKNYLTEWSLVTDAQYKTLSQWFEVEELKDLNYYLDLAEEKQKDYEERNRKYLEQQKARKEKAAKAAKTRKEKLLAKLKKELEDESNS